MCRRLLGFGLWTLASFKTSAMSEASDEEHGCILVVVAAGAGAAAAAAAAAVFLKH